MKINISEMTELDRPFEVGDIVLEKGFADIIGIVVEGRCGDFNVVVFDTHDSYVYINHSKDITQEDLKYNYKLISPSENNIINITSNNNKAL